MTEEEIMKLIEEGDKKESEEEETDEEEGDRKESEDCDINYLVICIY